MTRGQLGAALASILLLAACGKLGPPVRASKPRASAAAVPAPAAGEAVPGDAADGEEKEKR